MSHGACPYLGSREWISEEFLASRLDEGLYESMLAAGFRRSGRVFYRNRCPGCSSCVPVRLDASREGAGEARGRTGRRLARRNAELDLALLPVAYAEERYLLYERYRLARHADEEAGREVEDHSLRRASYAAFLLDSPLGASSVADYRLPDGRLAATGYLDLLPGGLSSVYFAFDPEFHRRGLGTWSVGREAALARELGKRWYYLGFWVPGSPKMDYKAGFGPFEAAIDGTWVPAAGPAEALALLPPAARGVRGGEAA